MNNVTIMGRLGQDPEIRSTQTGLRIANFSVATNRRDKEKTTDWHRCTAFDKQAELIAEHLKKGSQILLTGEIQYGSYEKNGIKMNTADIVVRSFEFVGSARDNQGQSAQQPVAQPAQQAPAQQAPATAAPIEDDIGF